MTKITNPYKASLLVTLTWQINPLHCNAFDIDIDILMWFWVIWLQCSFSNLCSIGQSLESLLTKQSAMNPPATVYAHINSVHIKVQWTTKTQKDPACRDNNVYGNKKYCSSFHGRFKGISPTLRTPTLLHPVIAKDHSALRPCHQRSMAKNMSDRWQASIWRGTCSGILSSAWWLAHHR